MTGWMYVALGAGVGSVLRYLLDMTVTHRLRRDGERLPLGTMTVNVLGSLVLGVLLGLAAHARVPHTVVLALGTGLCGGFTTFSTWAFETVVLAEDRLTRLALANAVLGTALSLCAAAVGLGVAALAT